MEISIPKNLEDLVLVITGSGRGMGRTYTDAFLAGGALVVATNRSWEGIKKPVHENVLVLTMDVTKEREIDAAYQATLDRFGTVDGLVNNAALRQRNLFPPSGLATTLETSDNDWEKSFGVNVFGALKVTRRFIQPMIERSGGSVVNIGSSGILHHSHGGGYVALRPDSREMPYQSSKAALATMGFYLADEVRKHNVTVNMVLPGYTRTTGFDEQRQARIDQGKPVGPSPMKPEHVVPLVGHLLSRDAKGITGKIFDALEWNAEHGFGERDYWQS